MYIGLVVLVRHNKIIQEGKVIKIYPEDLDIELKDKTIIRKKFWEIRKK